MLRRYRLPCLLLLCIGMFHNISEAFLHDPIEQDFEVVWQRFSEGYVLCDV